MQPRCLFVTFLMLNSIASAADIPALQPRDGAFRESLRDSAKISAARVVTGVMMDTGDAEAKPSAHVIVPASWKGGAFCARWLSSDARYEAWAEYLLADSEHDGVPSAWRGGLVRLMFDTSHAELLGSLTWDRLGVTVTQGTCDTPQINYAPVIWNGVAMMASNKLVLLVHARGADDVFLVLGGARDGEEKETFIDCTRLRHEYRVGIDHECEVPTSLLGPGRQSIQLNRLRRGLPDDPISFSVEMVVKE